MSKKHGCGGGYNMHHRMTFASGGRDNWPPNNLVRVLVSRHNLWNQIANGLEPVQSILPKINAFLARYNVQVKLEKIL